jgi:(p)ppGpp synthase/HD superfamily hydrolase
MQQSPLVLKAEETAKREHNRLNQTRSNGDPYWTHPERIYKLLIEQGITDEAILAAAWLHDVPEDCATCQPEAMDMIDLWHATFSPEIAKIVQELTNWIPKGTPFHLKQASLISHALKMSDKAKIIKVADRYDNLSGMENWPIHIQERYAKAGLELLEALKPIPEPAKALADSTIKKAKAILTAKKG